MTSVELQGINMETGYSQEKTSDETLPKPNLNNTPDIKIIRRKLNGYVGFANLPKQWHRKSIRKGFSLNLMVVGESGLGKSTLINTLFNSEIYPSKAAAEPSDNKSTSVKIEKASSDIQEGDIKLHLTVVTAPGFGEAINNNDSWVPIVEEINSRFDLYLEAESKINRSTVVDDRIHALLYFIEPTGHSLKPLDITFMKSVHEKVNLIPIIAKSDTLTEDEIVEFKQRVLDDIEAQGIKLFTPPQYENDDEESASNTRDIISKVPYAVVGSTAEVTTPDGRKVRGRSYPWGIIEVDNEDHCDFITLRQLLVRKFLVELKEKTSKVLYENYRSEKLKKMGITQDDSVFREFDPASRQEEERSLHETKLANMEAEMKSVFQQKVSEKEKKLQKSEADLFARHKEVKENLLNQIKLLEEKKVKLETQKSLPTEPAAPAKTRKGFLR